MIVVTTNDLINENPCGQHVRVLLRYSVAITRRFADAVNNQTKQSPPNQKEPTLL